jgi:hypothetical protein
MFHQTWIVFVLCYLVFSLVLSSAEAWTRTEKDIRLPGELRIVNEGLSHDHNFWYLSNQHILYKTTVYPMKIVTANHHAIPEELGKQRYNHIGDIDVFEGKVLIIFCLFVFVCFP